MEIYGCIAGEGVTYNVGAVVECGTGTGCNYIEEYAPAGYCYDDEIKQLINPHTASMNFEKAIYVTAYVKNCRGEYVAIRTTMAR